MTGHDCLEAETCPVCGGCLVCGPHAPGRWVEINGQQTVDGPCRDVLTVLMLDNLELAESVISTLTDSPGTSPRTRRMAEDLARQIGADRDAILGTGGL